MTQVLTPRTVDRALRARAGAVDPDALEAGERAQLVEWPADVHLAASGFGAPRIQTDQELGPVASESARRYGASVGTAR